MRKTLLSLTIALIGAGAMFADIIPIQGVDYQADLLIQRDLGPGVNYRRYRIPEFPLNVNVVVMDLNNPYNRVETTQGGEQLGKTEKLAAAYTRQYTDEKRPLAGANGNFWCVSSQYPWADYITGATFNGNVRNGEIITETNAHADWWGHNNGSPGCVAITPTKEMVIDFMHYKGYVSNDKIGKMTIQQTNKLVREHEIGLYNSFFGRDKSFLPVDQYANESGVQHLKLVENVSTEVYLNINEGHSWMVGRPMECTVQEVKYNAGRGTLGNYDLCLVGRGGNLPGLAKLEVGDVVTIDLKWKQPDGSAPEIEQLIGGNGVVMVDGVLTNLNQIDDYNSKTYSRCCYGTTADRKTLVCMVIDMSVDPVYGRSAGCNTLVMCDIMKYLGCTNIMNMDAGGSAQMMVAGKVVNTTTEGNPRAVANGWFFYSIAPKDDKIARLEFDDVYLKAPSYSSVTPKILGYNQYGDLIDEDVKGFTLSCDENIGACEGDVFTAGATSTTGNLTATLDGVSVTKEITILAAAPSIRIKPLLIDAARQYSMEVVAEVDGTVYDYNPATVEWKVSDETIVNIDANGVLVGLKEGSTEVVGTIGGVSDTTIVSVEIAPEAKMYVSNVGWKIKGSGAKNITMTQDGTMSFTYSSGRSNYIQLDSVITYYSLPDKLWMTVNSTMAVTSIDLDLRTPLNTRTNTVELLPQDTTIYELNKDNVIEIPISALGDPSDLILYPITLRQIKFNLEKSASYNGAHSLRLSDVYAEYLNYSGVESIDVDNVDAVKVYPNPVTDGTFIVVSSGDIEFISVYSMSGSEVLRTICAGNCITVDASTLSAGIYVVKVKTANGIDTDKLIIK